jgi:hypothetical protein
MMALQKSCLNFLPEGLPALGCSYVLKPVVAAAAAAAAAGGLQLRQLLQPNQHPEHAWQLHMKHSIELNGTCGMLLLFCGRYMLNKQ